MSIFTKLFSWFRKEAKTVEQEAAKIGVIVVEGLKTASANGSLDVVGTIVDVLTKSGVGTSIVAKIKEILPNAFSLFFALEAPPAGATVDQLNTWSQAVLKAMGLNSSKDQEFTEIAVNIAREIQNDVAENKAAGKPGDLSFGQYATLVEDAWQDYEAHEIPPVVETPQTPIPPTAG